MSGWPEECSKGFSDLAGRTEYHAFQPPTEAGRMCQCGERRIERTADGDMLTIAASPDDAERKAGA